MCLCRSSYRYYSLYANEKKLIEEWDLDGGDWLTGEIADQATPLRFVTAKLVLVLIIEKVSREGRG